MNRDESSDLEVEPFRQKATKDHEISKSHAAKRHTPRAARKNHTTTQIHRIHVGKKGSKHTVSTGGICLAFSMIFFPMLAVTIALLVLVLWERIRFSSSGTPDLPTNTTPPAGYYYTLVSAGKFTLVSSWASTVAGTASASFLFLFSFLVARSMVRRSEGDNKSGLGHKGYYSDPERQIRKILHSRTYTKLWKLVRSILPQSDRKSMISKTTFAIAIVGLGLNILFT